METSSVLLMCILVTCSVWTVCGRSLEVNIDDEEQVEVEISMNAGKSKPNLNKLRLIISGGGSTRIIRFRNRPERQLPGVCWACKWALNKVKKVVGPNATAEKLTPKLKSICNQIGLLKSLCYKFVKAHFAELIEELSTTDDVKTICINTGACKPKELSDLLFYPSKESSVEIISDVVIMGNN